ncbi:hypothetical protein K6W59_17015, partial [Erwinia amylovora]|uniref:hypothetical protein n=2 Tax=Erwinia amylovora TaxID=552 RepID=UPI0013E2AA15
KENPSSGIEQKYAYKTNEKAGFPAFYGVPLMLTSLKRKFPVKPEHGEAQVTSCRWHKRRIMAIRRLSAAG